MGVFFLQQNQKIIFLNGPIKRGRGKFSDFFRLTKLINAIASDVGDDHHHCDNDEALMLMILARSYNTFQILIQDGSFSAVSSSSNSSWTCC